MIDYVEIRNKERSVIGLIDTAKSIIWKSTYYGVGEFEIYTSCTLEAKEILKVGNYVTRINNFEVGIIEKIETENNDDDGLMIIASGRFIKSILDRRIVYQGTLQGVGNAYWWSCNATILKGNVELAIRQLISDNAVHADDQNRNIPEIDLNSNDISNLPETIIVEDTKDEETSAEKQVTYKNLLEYTDSVLEEYKLGARMWLDLDTLKFRYKIYKGKDHTSASSEPIIFSKEFDNLTSTNYIYDATNEKTTALIGGEGEGTERKCAFAYAWLTGLERKEAFIDASSLTQEELDIETYRKQLEAQGRQSLTPAEETFEGSVDLTNSNLVYGIDYELGDLVTIEDKDINKYIYTRIIAVTEVQDDDGYIIELEFGV